MTLRTKSEQKAYLDGYEMCADGIKKYLTDEGKRKLESLVMSVRIAVDIEDETLIKALERKPKTGHWEYGYAFADGNYCKCSECKEIIKCIYPMHYCPNCGADMRNKESE